MKSTRHKGFTLIELSIVLVIIGLIVGGVLVGRDLIHAAQMRKVITEQEQLVTAIRTFEGKYNCIPGDCAKATQFFGTAGTCDGSVNLTSTATCNGSGDGVLCSPNDTACYFVPGYQGENLLAAHHLQIAHLVGLPLATPASTVPTFAGGVLFTPGQNIFGSGYNSGFGWDFGSIPASWVATTGGPAFCGNYPTGQNELFFGSLGAWGPVGSGQNITGQFQSSGLDYYNIDSKIDDGKPSTGYVISPTWNYVNAVITRPTCDGSYQASTAYIPSATAFGGLVFMANF